LLVPLLETDMDDLVLDIPIHKSRHSAIIGRKGLTIAALSADHNVRVMVPKSNTHAPPVSVVQGESNNDASPTTDAQLDPVELAKQRRRENIIQLEGQLDNVEKCVCKVLNIVSPDQTEKEVTFPALDQQPIQNMPSTVKLNQIAKKTNTNIQRKRLEVKNGNTTAPDEKTKEENDSLPADQQQPEENSSQHSSPTFENRLIITGRSDSVDYAISILSKVILESTTSNNEPHMKEKPRGHTGRGGRKPYKGRGSGRRGRGRGDMNSTGRGGNSYLKMPHKRNSNSTDRLSLHQLIINCSFSLYHKTQGCLEDNSN